MVSTKIVILSVTTLVLGATLLAFLTGAENGFYFEAVNDEELGDDEKMYFTYDGKYITYDLITKQVEQGSENGIAGYQLTRLEAVDGDYRMVIAYLDADYAVINLGAIFGDNTPSWEYFDVEDMDELTVSSVSSNNYSVTDSSGESIEIGLDADGNPTSFGDMKITNFVKYAVGTVDAPSSCPTCDIATGTIGGAHVVMMTEEEKANVANVDENNRALAGHTRKLVSNVGGNHRCYAEISKSAYKQAVNSGASVEKVCDGKSTVSFQGTKTGKDVFNDILGILDNFERGWKNVADKSVRDKNHAVCTGHSLGGAIAKYNAKMGNCDSVVTFGAPQTRFYPTNKPITQYVNTKYESSGCCKRKWNGSCKTRGKYTKDPITLVGTVGGSNINSRYINGGSNAKCWSTRITAVLFNQHLHDIDNYVART